VTERETVDVARRFFQQYKAKCNNLNEAGANVVDGDPTYVSLSSRYGLIVSECGLCWWMYIKIGYLHSLKTFCSSSAVCGAKR
jgi:hypothetical protein